MAAWQGGLPGWVSGARATGGARAGRWRRLQAVGVARLGFVGVAGMEPPPAVAQRQIGLQRRAVLLVVRGGDLRVVARPSSRERERPLVEALLRFGIDRQQAVGRRQRAGRVAGEAAGARQQRQRDAIAGQPPAPAVRRRGRAAAKR